jgi:signal transduction histidine kinase
VLIAEDHPRWGIELEHLRRDLALLAAVSLLAVLALAALVLRATASQWAIERRMSRSENLAAMGRMTATLAHEIKNPLAIIRGSARRLGRLAPDAQAMADSVVEEVDRLSGTVNRYLEFARGGTPEGPLRGDAAATLAATVTLLQGEVGARGCTLAFESAEVAATVPLDDASLKQVWLNLVQNALEAVPDGGAVRAECRVAEGRVRVRIVDDGPGIPPEVLARLGEPFYTTRAQGTGLGLYLSKRLVEGVGGSLRVERGPERGTVVTVEFPVA